MKTTEELNAIKAEVMSIREKLEQLTNEELKQVTGGTEGVRIAVINIDSCIQCGVCESACPLGAIRDDGGGYVVYSNNCSGCTMCVDSCPGNAISIMMI